MRPLKDIDPEELRRLRQILGRRLRTARAARDLVQEEVARCVQVTTEHYARLERGYALPSVSMLCRLIVFFDASADFLLGLEDGEASESRGGGAMRDDFVIPHQSRGSRREACQRALIRRLRVASPKALRVVAWVLRELDRASASGSSDSGTAICPSPDVPARGA